MRKNKVVETRRQEPTTVSKTTVQDLVCLKNHAVDHGPPIFDGCQEFMASGEHGAAALTCAASGCQRGYHKKLVHVEVNLGDSGCSHESSTSGG
ncbi:mini zinc finger protein 3-like [Lotus japonicus]|uniref:mini zinc finger protein 3-like n=1 Tax=Lotus japonicus TaxID=34305 RepID=UPI00258BFF89|nr:mini zinc finger protein 3-like [Lotus japonicus]